MLLRDRSMVPIPAVTTRLSDRPLSRLLTVYRQQYAPEDFLALVARNHLIATIIRLHSLAVPDDSPSEHTFKPLGQLQTLESFVTVLCEPTEELSCVVLHFDVVRHASQPGAALLYESNWVMVCPTPGLLLQLLQYLLQTKQQPIRLLWPRHWRCFYFCFTCSNAYTGHCSVQTKNAGGCEVGGVR